MFAIFGSGFGLYGYLPALVEGCKQRIVLPERYRARISGRPELEGFLSYVRWEIDESAALARADGLVLALRPADQSGWVDQFPTLNNIERLILEKPLAQSPEIGKRILATLIRSRRAFRIAYIFRYTEWGKKLLRCLDRTGKNGLLSIRWEFMAHHFLHNLHNWKRFNVTGGGALRFYGIHLIALFAEIGYRNVVASHAIGVTPDEVEKWTATFTGPGLPECEVTVDTKSTRRQFCVEQVSNAKGSATMVFASLGDPFETENGSNLLEQPDQRVPVLTQLCRSLLEEGKDEEHYERYGATIDLWQILEDKTKFEELQT